MPSKKNVDFGSGTSRHQQPLKTLTLAPNIHPLHEAVLKRQRTKIRRRYQHLGTKPSLEPTELGAAGRNGI